jgi:hypothetical protein
MELLESELVSYCRQRLAASGALPLKQHQWNIDAVTAASMEH